MTPARTPARTSGGTADQTGRVTSRQRPLRTTPEPSPTAAIRTAPSRVRITEPVPVPRGPASETASTTTTTTARYPPMPASHADRTGWADPRAGRLRRHVRGPGERGDRLVEVRRGRGGPVVDGSRPVSYTHLTLPTNREV